MPVQPSHYTCSDCLAHVLTQRVVTLINKMSPICELVLALPVVLLGSIFRQW